MNGDTQPKPDAPGPDSNWQYRPNAPTPTAPVAPPVADMPQPLNQSDLSGPQDVTWSASEFIAHHKSIGWYATLGLSAIAFAAVIYLLTKDEISTGVVIIAALLFGIAAGRKPRVLEYHLNNAGLLIAQKFYPYSDFKSFAISQEGALSSIIFLPLKRFMPSITVYYEPQDEEHITYVLSQHLPLEQHVPDVVDRLTSRIRF